MRILGVSEGLVPSAAVVVDDRVVSWVPGERLPVRDAEDDDAGTTAAIEAALAQAQLSREEIDLIAVAGRYRSNRTRVRPPWLRRLAQDPMSPLREGEAALQGLLRRTGLGAFRADVEAEARESALHEQGFTRARLRLVDTHRALAEAAYRTQAADDVRILVVEPYGDGELASWYAGRAGQLDRVWDQVGPDPLHALMDRLGPALRLPSWDAAALGAAAARGVARREVVDTLSGWLGHHDGELVGRLTPTLVDPLPTLLRDVPPADAAASVLSVLARALVGLTEHHLRADPTEVVCVAGRLAVDPRVVGGLVEAIDGPTWAGLPGSSDAAAALGAAFAHAQPPPRALSWWCGPSAREDAARIAQRLGPGAQPLPGLLGPLLDGDAVIRWAGHAAPGADGLGGRAVLVRADDEAAMQRARRRLRLPASVAPRLLCLPMRGLDDRAGAAVRAGLVARVPDRALAARVPAAVSPDGSLRPTLVREGQGEGLADLLAAIGRVTGTPAVASLPIVEADTPPVVDPHGAVEVLRRTGLAAIETDLGTWARP